MRLQKFLSNIGFCSRSDAERLIDAGRVVIDGRRAVLGDKVSGGEVIEVDGHRLKQNRAGAVKVIAFHKPVGVECTLSASRSARTLNDFAYGKERVFPIGGLDSESCGLLLLTNDGDLGHRLARPGDRHADEYALTLAGHAAADALERLRAGLRAEKMESIVRDVRLQCDRLLCVLHEGRSKLLRRLCRKAGLGISQVQRVRIGPILLGDLAPGKWRLLSEAEVRRLQAVGGARRRIVPRGK